MPYVLTQRARLQLARMRAFYRHELELPYLAYQETDRIFEAIDGLTDRPAVDYAAPFEDHPNVRRLPVRPYVIYYARSEQLVVVLEISWSREDHETMVRNRLAA